MNRRNWLKNATGLLVAAPFVVRADALMKVVPVMPSFVEMEIGMTEGFRFVQSEMLAGDPFFVPKIWSEFLATELYRRTRLVDMFASNPAEQNCGGFIRATMVHL